jgi:hypothetical protein
LTQALVVRELENGLTVGERGVEVRRRHEHSTIGNALDESG